MELEGQTPRKRNNRRLLGLILIGIGAVLCVVMVAVSVVPRTISRTVRVAPPAMPEMPAMPVMPDMPPMPEMVGVAGQIEMAERQMEMQMEMAERQLEMAERQTEMQMEAAERQMEMAARQFEYIEPRVSVRRGLWFGGFGLLAGLLRLGITVATFALLGLGAFLLIREISKNRHSPAEAAPMTGREADRARDA